MTPSLVFHLVEDVAMCLLVCVRAQVFINAGGLNVIMKKSQGHGFNRFWCK